MSTEAVKWQDGKLLILDQRLIPAREEWLEATLTAFTGAVERGGLDIGTMARQGDVHASLSRLSHCP